MRFDGRRGYRWRVRRSVKGAPEEGRKGSLALLFLGVALVALGYFEAFLPLDGGDLVAGLLVSGTALSLAGATALGTATARGRPGWAAVFVFLVVGGGLGSVLVMAPTEGADPTLILGLPPRAALLIYGVGVVPAFVLPLLYAATFRGATLADEDLNRVREAARLFSELGEGAGDSSPEG